MSSSPVAKSFLIDFPDGYFLVSMVAYTSIARSPPPDTLVHLPPDTLDIKLILVSLKRLQVVEGTAVAEFAVTEPFRISMDHSLVKNHEGKYDDGQAQLIDELNRGLSMVAPGLQDAASSQITDGFRNFLREATKCVVSRDHRALWISLTLDMVSRVPYNETIDMHRLMMNESRKPRTSLREKICSCCGSRCTPHDEFMRMPCGDYCHIGCIWSWPRKKQ